MNNENFDRAIMRVMIYVMLADGIIESSELLIIQNIYNRLTGSNVSESFILQEIDSMNSSNKDTKKFIKTLEPHLKKTEKDIIFKSAFLVAFSDADFDKKEKTVMYEISDALKMTEHQVQGLIEELTQS